MTWKYMSHFFRLFVVLEVGLQVLQVKVFQDLLFHYFGSIFIGNILWNIIDLLLLLLVIGGFFKYLRQEGLQGMVGYFKWIFCSFGLLLMFNLRLWFFFFSDNKVLLKLENYDYDLGVFLARFFLLILAIFFLTVLYFDVMAKRLFILELPFLVGLLIWFFLLSVRSFNFLFLFLLMESITLLLVVILSIYFVFFGAKLLKPVIHFFVFNLIISTFFLLGLGLLFFLIPVSSGENLSYFMVLINFWTFFLSGFIDPLLLLFIFKFSLACFILPFLFKLTLAPFSFWVINIYSRLPIIFLFILMGVYKFIYILLFLKIFFYVLDVITIIQLSISIPLIGCIIPSMFIGCFAYRASDLKTILALTTVSQMGYIISGLISHDVMAIKYALIYLLVYVLNLSGIFIIFVKIQKEFFLVNLNQLFLVKSYSKKWFYILFIIFASLAGFPPFAGFFLKYFLFLHIYKSGFFVLAAAGVISGYIMAIIYLQILMELSLVKTIAWSEYQSFLLSGLTCQIKNSKSEKASVLRKEKKVSKQIYIFLNLIIISLAVLNVFFLFLLPFFAQYFGFFTFFFVYGLFHNIDIPKAKQEMVWFANSFSNFPIDPLNPLAEMNSLQNLHFVAATVNTILDVNFLPYEGKARWAANARFSEDIMHRFIQSSGEDAWKTQMSIRGVGEFWSLNFINAWYIPSMSLKEYMYPLECLTSDLEYLLGSLVPSNLDKIEGITIPASAIRQAYGVFGIEEGAYQQRVGYVYYVRDFSLLCANSAYDVLDNRLFGYHLWDAAFPRFYYEMGYPPVLATHPQLNLAWVAGVKNAKMYIGSTLYIHNPLIDDPYELLIRMRRDDFELAEKLFKSAMKNTQETVEIYKSRL